VDFCAEAVLVLCPRRL